jgi:hypothetical protein
MPNVRQASCAFPLFSKGIPSKCGNEDAKPEADAPLAQSGGVLDPKEYKKEREPTRLPFSSVKSL